MTGLDDLLRRCDETGVTVAVDDSAGLAVTGPWAAVTSLVNELRQHKDALLEVLRTREGGEPLICIYERQEGDTTTRLYRDGDGETWCHVVSETPSRLESSWGRATAENLLAKRE